MAERPLLRSIAAVDVDVRVLGPFQVVVNGVDVTPVAPKERALLALLVMRHGRVVAADQLMEELWPTLAVDRARRVLQVRVAAVRKQLATADAASLLALAPPGYRLGIADDSIDEFRFMTLVARARGEVRTGDWTIAADSLREALDLWRGEALADVQACVSLEAEAARLREARLGAVEDRIDAVLACGGHRAVVGELDALVVQEPLRERLWAQRIVALYRCDRHAEAVRACAFIRGRLKDELGVEPGPALCTLEAAVRAQRPELEWSGSPRSRSSRWAPPPSKGPVVTGFEVGTQPSRSKHMPIPRIRYARTEDGINLAYQVVGDGPLDLIVVPGYISHLDTWWEAWSGRLVRRLASFCRLILFDKRGMGLSDRPPNVDVEQWMEDTKTVLDAAGSEQAAVLGVTAGGLIAMLFAATYPARTHSLMVYGGFARQLQNDDDYPIGLLPQMVDAHVEYSEARWGSGVGLRLYCPSVSDDPAAREQYGKYQRASASPGAASAYLRALAEIDVRHALPMINAPTLVLHAKRDRVIPVELARYVADRVPNATLVEVDSADHLIWFSDALDVITDEIQDFLIGALPSREICRVLSTVLFIDEVEPTRRSQALDDRRRKESHCAEARASQLIDRFRGRTVRHGNEGILVTFDGPARAIRCACAIVDDFRSAGHNARAGLHSGECDATGDDISGVAVQIARGVADLADPGEVLVSQTVRDLVCGSAITFRGRSSIGIRGIPGDWRVYAVTGT
jgi:DNA-binding SARP family transcriptional activator/pimeloyl-ACP methyl ester carboxylesterase